MSSMEAAVPQPAHNGPVAEVQQLLHSNTILKLSEVTGDLNAAENVEAVAAAFDKQLEIASDYFPEIGREARAQLVTLLLESYMTSDGPVPQAYLPCIAKIAPGGGVEQETLEVIRPRASRTYLLNLKHGQGGNLDPLKAFLTSDFQNSNGAYFAIKEFTLGFLGADQIGREMRLTLHGLTNRRQLARLREDPEVRDATLASLGRAIAKGELAEEIVSMAAVMGVLDQLHCDPLLAQTEDAIEGALPNRLDRAVDLSMLLPWGDLTADNLPPRITELQARIEEHICGAIEQYLCQGGATFEGAGYEVNLALRMFVSEGRQSTLQLPEWLATGALAALDDTPLPYHLAENVFSLLRAAEQFARFQEYPNLRYRIAQGVSGLIAHFDQEPPEHEQLNQLFELLAATHYDSRTGSLVNFVIADAFVDSVRTFYEGCTTFVDGEAALLKELLEDRGAPQMLDIDTWLLDAGLVDRRVVFAEGVTKLRQEWEEAVTPHRPAEIPHPNAEGCRNLLARGKAAYYWQDPGSAISHVEPVVELGQEHSELRAERIEAVLLMGRSHEALNGLQRAARCYEVCLQLTDPEDTQAVVERNADLMRISFGRGRFELVERHGRDLLTLLGAADEPDSSVRPLFTVTREGVVFDFALAVFAQRRVEEAQRFFDKALETASSADLLAAFSNYHKYSLPYQAEVIAEKYLEVTPDKGRFIGYINLCLGRQGVNKYNEAVQAIRDARALVEEHQGMDITMDLFLSNLEATNIGSMGDVDEAIKIITAVIVRSNTPDMQKHVARLKARKTLVVLHFQNGNTDEAEPLAAALWRDVQDQPVMRDSIGPVVLHVLGTAEIARDPAKGVKHIDLAIEIAQSNGFKGTSILSELHLARSDVATLLSPPDFDDAHDELAFARKLLEAAAGPDQIMHEVRLLRHEARIRGREGELIQAIEVQNRALDILSPSAPDYDVTVHAVACIELADTLTAVHDFQLDYPRMDRINYLFAQAQTLLREAGLGQTSAYQSILQSIAKLRSQMDGDDYGSESSDRDLPDSW